MLLLDIMWFISTGTGLAWSEPLRGIHFCLISGIHIVIDKISDLAIVRIEIGALRLIAVNSPFNVQVWNDSCLLRPRVFLVCRNEVRTIQHRIHVNHCWVLSLQATCPALQVLQIRIVPQSSPIPLMSLPSHCQPTRVALKLATVGLSLCLLSYECVPLYHSWSCFVLIIPQHCFLPWDKCTYATLLLWLVNQDPPNHACCPVLQL